MKGMINREDMLELTRRMTPSRTSFTRPKSRLHRNPRKAPTPLPAQRQPKSLRKSSRK